MTSLDCPEGEAVISEAEAAAGSERPNLEEVPTATSTLAGEGKELKGDVLQEKESAAEKLMSTETETKESDKETGLEAREGEEQKRDENVTALDDIVNQPEPNSEEQEKLANENKTTKHGQEEESIEDPNKVYTEEKTASEEDKGVRERESVEQKFEQIDENGLSEKEADGAKIQEQAVAEGESTALKDPQQVEQTDRQIEHSETLEDKMEGEPVDSCLVAPARGGTGEMEKEVTTELLADILEEDEEQEPIDREKLLEQTKVRLQSSLPH